MVLTRLTVSIVVPAHLCQHNTAHIGVMILVATRPARPIIRRVIHRHLAHMRGPLDVTTVTARVRELDTEHCLLKRREGHVRRHGIHQWLREDERIHFRKWICFSQKKQSWGSNTMAPTWMIDLMERGERLQVVAHEPPRGMAMRRAVSIWTQLRNKFLFMLV